MIGPKRKKEEEEEEGEERNVVCQKSTPSLRD
jgi:hypothetical protein